LIGQDTETLQPGDFEIRQCQDCGFYYLSNIPEGVELGKFYPPQYGAYNLSFGLKQSLYSKFTGLFVSRGTTSYFDIPILDPFGNRRVLDVGCGSGHLLKMYKDAGWDISGIDFSDLVVDKVNRMLGGPYCKAGAAERPEFDSETFSLITASQVLEHLEHPREALLNWRRLLTSDGRIIIAVPNFMSLNRRLFGKYWYGGLSLPRHFNHFSVKSLLEILQKTGLVALSIQGVPYPSSVNSLMLKLGMTYDNVNSSRLIQLLNTTTIFQDSILSGFNMSDGLLAVAAKVNR
jgi:2-polyprenyl-3-methyl-5-hydroxy-6-metoxy-1,4-benzoquinol methylase